MLKILLLNILLRNKIFLLYFRQIESYFCNDMDVDVACLEPVLWVHGHTHDSLDYMIEKTRVICNPYGYYGTDTGMVKDFNPSFIVEI